MKKWLQFGTKTLVFLRCSPSLNFTNKVIYPLRPVVSGVGSTLAPSASLIDNLLKPIVSADPRYLQDTRHALEIIKALEDDFKTKQVPFSSLYSVSNQYSWFVHSHVVSFYPSVPHEVAREAVSRTCSQLHLDEGHANAVISLLSLFEHSRDRQTKKAKGRVSKVTASCCHIPVSNIIPRWSFSTEPSEGLFIIRMKAQREFIRFNFFISVKNFKFFFFNFLSCDALLFQPVITFYSSLCASVWNFSFFHFSFNCIIQIKGHKSNYITSHATLHTYSLIN
jgi:hypothetical protein